MDAEAALLGFFREHRNVLVITGAGCSTPSGIAAYRDVRGRWLHAQPIMAQDFLQLESARQRYWARSMRGWPAFARAESNPAHGALARLERQGRLRGLITQNVDGLHQQAGHRTLIELHGNLCWVTCTGCGARVARGDVQRWLERENPRVLQMPAPAAPDGDAELAEQVGDIRVPACAECGSILKPDVVFYGESVPAARVKQAYEWVESADAVLVVGSSLMVYSSFRFLRRARELGRPMAAINRGITRADDWFAFKVADDCVTALARLVDGLEG